MLMPIVVMITAVGLGAIDHVTAFAFYPLTTTMFAMSFVAISDYLNRRIPSANRATILSIHNMIFSLSVAGMEPLLGWLGDTWGLPVAYRAGSHHRGRDRGALASTLAAGAPAGVVGRRSAGRRPRGRAGAGAAALGIRREQRGQSWRQSRPAPVPCRSMEPLPGSHATDQDGWWQASDPSGHSGPRACHHGCGGDDQAEEPEALTRSKSTRREMRHGTGSQGSAGRTGDCGSRTNWPQRIAPRSCWH